MSVYIGTYTNAKSKGIYRFDLDMSTGALASKGLAVETDSPSYLAVHPSHKFLYAVNEISNFKGEKDGAVSAFSIDPHSGKLTFINQQPSRGDGPCHIAMDKAGKNALVANYGAGSIAALPIKEDGSLAPATGFVQHSGSSVDSARQEGPHAHSVTFSPDYRFLMAADLGLDKVFIYHFDTETGMFSPNDPPAGEVPPGSGPRHFAFHPTAHFAYVINEMKSTLTTFVYDAKTGSLKAIDTVSTLPVGYKGSTSTAELQFHPSGKFLYGSNRGHDSISIFTVNGTTGKTHLIGNTPTHGKTPRCFQIDPTGTFLLAANQESDSLAVFRIDTKTGHLTLVGKPVEVPSPVCVTFAPAVH